jgi:hypothetical protein
MDKIPQDWLSQILGGLPPWMAGAILLALIGLAAWVAFLFFTKRKGSLASALGELDTPKTEQEFAHMAAGQEETLGRIQERLSLQGDTLGEVSKELTALGRELSKMQGRIEAND